MAKKYLTPEEVEQAIRAGKRLRYDYRSNEKGDLLMASDGRIYTKSGSGVITRAIPKVNGKLAKKQRQAERNAAKAA